VHADSGGCCEHRSTCDLAFLLAAIYLDSHFQAIFTEEVLVVKGGSVNPDERNLLSVAFKNLISSKRAACRTISAIE